MTDESSLPPCERFTALEWRKGEKPECDVCDHLEASHKNAGRRTMSGGEIEELRRRILVERHDLREQERQRSKSDGNGTP